PGQIGEALRTLGSGVGVERIVAPTRLRHVAVLVINRTFRTRGVADLAQLRPHRRLLLRQWLDDQRWNDLRALAFLVSVEAVDPIDRAFWRVERLRLDRVVHALRDAAGPTIFQILGVQGWWEYPVHWYWDCSVCDRPTPCSA